MRRSLAGWCLFIMTSHAAAMGPFDPPGTSAPEFVGPLVEPPVADSDGSKPPSPVADPASSPNPMPKPELSPPPLLVIPGMPNGRPASKPKAIEPQPSPSVTLSAPLPVDPPPSGSTAAPPSTLVSTPLRLETVPNDLPEVVESESEPSPKRTPRDAKPPRPTAPRPAIKRPSSLLNRIFPAFGKGRYSDGPNAVGNGIAIDPQGDPAADAALKRRVERQVREALGSRLKSFDVRVAGGEVVIRAQASRFWQKRADRAAIEALPALSGYKTIVEMRD